MEKGGGIQIVTNFTDRIFPQNSNFCPVSLKFHPLKHIIPIVTINILLGRRGVERGGIKIPGKLGRGGRAGVGEVEMEGGGIQIVTRTLMKDQELLFSSDMLLKIKQFV